MQIQNFPSGIPLSTDLLLFQSLVDNSYRKALISQLPFSNGGGGGWQLINGNYLATSNSRIFNYAVTDITLTLPIASAGQEIENFNFTSTSRIFINLQGKKYLAATYEPTNLVCQGDAKNVRLVYIDEINGWYLILNELDPISAIPTYIYLPLNETSGTVANDISGNNRNGMKYDKVGKY